MNRIGFENDMRVVDQRAFMENAWLIYELVENAAPNSVIFSPQQLAIARGLANREFSMANVRPLAKDPSDPEGPCWTSLPHFSLQQLERVLYQEPAPLVEPAPAEKVSVEASVAEEIPFSVETKPAVAEAKQPKPITQSFFMRLMSVFVFLLLAGVFFGLFLI